MKGLKEPAASANTSAQFKLQGLNMHNSCAAYETVVTHKLITTNKYQSCCFERSAPRVLRGGVRNV